MNQIILLRLYLLVDPPNRDPVPALKSLHRWILPRCRRRRTWTRPLDERPVNPKICRRAGWEDRVALRYAELRAADATLDSPTRRSVLLKRAIRRVSALDAAGREEVPAPATSTADCLSVAMAFLRAVELHRAHLTMDAWNKVAKMPATTSDVARCFIQIV